MSFFIDFTDKRNQHVFKILKSKGFTVFELENNQENIKQGDSYVFSPAKKFLPQEVLSFKNQTNLYAGKVSDEILKIFHEKQIEYKNMMEDEEFVIKNALLTAEGVLAHIISATSKSIFKNKILVVGTGRVGKAILHLLDKLNLDLTLVCFSKNKLTENLYWQKPVILASELKDRIKEFDIVINTAPIKVFEDTVLDYFAEGTVVLEISSFVCLNKDLAQEKGITFISAQGLPQVFSCESAGELVASFLLK